MRDKRTHTVPRFYLRNFGSEIYRYDKLRRKVERASPKTACWEWNFYTQNFAELTGSVEDMLGKLESDASRAIFAVVRKGRYTDLDDKHKAALCRFVTIQYLRTQEYRRMRQSRMNNMLDALTERMGVNDWGIREKKEYAGAFHLQSMLNHHSPLSKIIAQKEVCLCINKTREPLWTSDNPVVRHNDLIGKLGADSPGVQFYLPLTPKLLLVFYDTAHIDLLNDAGECGDAEDLWMRAHNNSLKTASMEEADVIRANLLQTTLSTRFVFSDRPDFPKMGEFLGINGGDKTQGVFRSPGKPDVLSWAEGWGHNLQNALLRYRAARQDTDMSRAFVTLFGSLEVAANLVWVEDGKEFDDTVRELTGDPELPIGRLRQLRDCIRGKGHADLNADGTDMAERVAEMRRIVAKVVLRRLKELQAVD